jgi:hypothetical protein
MKPVQMVQPGIECRQIPPGKKPVHLPTNSKKPCSFSSIPLLLVTERLKGKTETFEI